MKLREQSVTPNQGLSYFRYGRSVEFMQSPVKHKENSCYCRWWNESTSLSSSSSSKRSKSTIVAQHTANNRRCNYDGILDLGSCYSGFGSEGSASAARTTANRSNQSSNIIINSPVILSNPHFSGQVTKSIMKEVSGLTPDESLYTSYVDIEPVSLGLFIYLSTKK